MISIRSIPKDPGWLGRWFRDDIDHGRIGGPLEIGDVWPENYSSNSVQKVWAAKFAARHPNVAVLDLSSFKCGHDAPTYGLIDDILKAGRTPFMTLHDIDANMALGSQRIRVKTFAHTLSRYEEDLADRADRMGELERRVEAHRRELVAARRVALERAARDDVELRRRIDEMGRAFDAYLAEEEVGSRRQRGRSGPALPGRSPPSPKRRRMWLRCLRSSPSSAGRPRRTLPRAAARPAGCAIEAPVAADAGLIQIGGGSRLRVEHYREDAT